MWWLPTATVTYKPASPRDAVRPHLIPRSNSKTTDISKINSDKLYKFRICRIGLSSILVYQYLYLQLMLIPLFIINNSTLFGHTIDAATVLLGFLILVLLLNTTCQTWRSKKFANTIKKVTMRGKFCTTKDDIKLENHSVYSQPVHSLSSFAQ